MLSHHWFIGLRNPDWKLLAEIRSTWELARDLRELASRATEVSYAKLYEAVQALAVGAATCPACGTNLDTVAEDPFIRARTGLESLAQLAQIQLRSKHYEQS
jgi:hypothetical protein